MHLYWSWRHGLFSDFSLSKKMRKRKKNETKWKNSRKNDFSLCLNNKV